MGRRLWGQSLLPAAENCRVSVLEPRDLGDHPYLMDERGRPWREAAHSGFQGRRKQLGETQRLLGEGKGHSGSMGVVSAAFGVFMSQCVGIGKEVKEKWPSSSPFNWSGECGWHLGLFLPLSLPQPSAELGFPGVWLFLRGPSPDESPPTGLERNCQPVTMRQPPSLKRGEEKRMGNTQRKLRCLL